MALGAVVIGLDIVFPEPDRLSPARFATGLPQGDEALAVALSALPDNDAVLEASLAASRVALGEAGQTRALDASTEPPRVASSEERRVGHVCVGLCRSRREP